MKSTLLLAMLLFSSGFSAWAADTEARLGDFQLNSVSEIVQFYTADGSYKMWHNNPGVTVYHPDGRTPYEKTDSQMKKLPAGAIVRIKESLVKTRPVHIPVAQTAAEVCGEFITPVWKCQDRLMAFNGNATKRDTWNIPAAVNVTLVYKTPPPKKNPPNTDLELANFGKYDPLMIALFVFVILVLGAISYDQHRQISFLQNSPAPPGNRLYVRSDPVSRAFRRLHLLRRTRRTQYEDPPTRRVARRETRTEEERIQDNR